MHNALYVLHGFCGQSHHEVQLHRGESAGKGNAGSSHQFFFADIFVDNVPQPLGACFRCESQTAFPHALNPIHQLLGKIIHPQRGQSDVDAVFVQIGQQFVQRFFQLAVVAGTQRGQGQFLIAGGIAERTALPDNGFRRFLPKRTVQKACLTETAAPYAAAKHFFYGTVVHRFHKGYHKCFRIERLVHVLYDPFGHLFRCTVFRRHCGNGTVRLIGHLVQRGHIDPLDLCRRTEKCRAACSLPLHLQIEVHEFQIDFLALPQNKQVEKVRQRFRITDAGTAGNHQRCQCFAAVTGMQRNPCQVQHIQDIGI